MTREDAIKWTLLIQQSEPWQDRVIEALDMAIEALERERTDEWCTDCKEYETEKKCCPRFNRVIREAMKRIPHDDGTLEVKVEDATKVGRVLISDDKHRGGLYYPDEDEPQSVSFENDTKVKSCSKDSDLISRAEAIEAIEIVDWYHQNSNKDMVHGANDDEHQAWYKADDVYRALEAVPSADRPRGEEDQLKFYYVESIDDYWIGMRIDNFYYADWHEGLGFVWSKSRYLPWGEHIVDENTLWKEHTYPSEPIEIPFTDWIVGFVKKYFADRPRGHWMSMADFEQCSVCHGTHLKEVDTYYGKATWIKTDYCPNCGAKMDRERSEDE